MRLIITRHGETEGNVIHLFQGQNIQGELSEKGKDQARRLANRLKDEKIDLIISSDLKRAIDTAEEIMRYHPHLKLKIDKRITERSFGDLEGKSVPEGWDWKKMPAQVETNIELCKRAKEFLDNIYPRYKDKTVLLICHAGTKMAFLTVIHNQEVSEFESWGYLKNTSLSIFDIKEDKKHIIHVINCTKHLE